MTTILESRSVNAPLGSAPAYLRQYIREIFTEHKGRLPLSIAAPVRRSNGDSIALREDVVFDFAKMVTSYLLTGQSALAWRPVHGGGMIPSFSGHLTIAADKSDDSCHLVLQGTYEPPLGAIGALFDAVVGKSIAHATAQRLVKRIGRRIESMHLESINANLHQNAART